MEVTWDDEGCLVEVLLQVPSGIFREWRWVWLGTLQDVLRLRSKYDHRRPATKLSGPTITITSYRKPLSTTTIHPYAFNEGIYWCGTSPDGWVSSPVLTWQRLIAARI